MDILDINNIKAINCMGEGIKKLSEVLKEKQYTATIDKRCEELALKLGTSADNLGQYYPNYTTVELERMIQGKDTYRVLCALITGTFKKPRFSLKLEKINY